MTTTCYAHHPSPMGVLLLVGEQAPGGGTALTGCYFPHTGAGRPSIWPGTRTQLPSTRSGPRWMRR